ncbi:MAG: M4 family metallopeptidase [Chloroflexota bacterium]
MSRSMFRAVAGVLLACGLALPVQAAGPGGGPTADQALLSELRGNGARIERHGATGKVRFIVPTRGHAIATRAALGRPGSPEAAAALFVARYGSLFGVPSAAQNLRLERSARAAGGATFVRYQQMHRGVPVLGGEINVQVGKATDVMSANGEASPGLRELGVEPAITAGVARQTAVAAIAKWRGLRAAGLTAVAPELWVYDPALLGGSGLPTARLVWRTEVTNRTKDMRELVLVDALRGSIALHFDQIAQAKNRITCDGGDTVAGTADAYPCTLGEAARIEGGPASVVADVNDAHDFAGDTYDFYFNRFGRDSLDDAGMTLVSTVRYCEGGNCPYENAFWDSSQMVYGAGFASADDVVGHELTHGVTEFTSGLFYYYQSGAINEALSDIFGEYIDLTNGTGSDDAADRWLMGEDLPAPIGAIRDMQDPPAFGQPNRMTSSLYTGTESDQGGVHTNSGVANKAAYLMTDGDTFNGQAIIGLGIDKAAAIWYRVETSYLVSGSDYADLGSALNQACADLVGTTPNQNNGSPSPSGAITAANCTEVGQAVLATEMAQQPTDPDAAAPEAELCTSGTLTNTWFDDLENSASGNWTSAVVTGSRNVWYYPQNPNPYVATGWDPTYATSGTTNFWGDDIGSVSDSAIRMTNPVTIPTGGFLHFRHAYFLEAGWDGGVVEYQVGGGAWSDASALQPVNGYNGTVPVSQYGNPLGGRSVFTGESHGYISTRYGLSSLAGQSVRFRFRIGTDSFIGDWGWFLDDIRIYSCGDTTPPTVTAPDTDFRASQTLASGGKARLRVAWKASDPGGISSTKLQQSVNGGAFANVTLASATSVAKNVNYAASTTATRQFRARATDTTGNISPYEPGDIFKVRAFQNGSASVVQAGTWKGQSASGFYGGSVRYASAAGRTQSLTANVTDFAILTTRGPNRGIAEVRVDGVLKATIDLYRSNTQKRWVMYSISFPTAGTHTIELRVKGTKRAASSSTRIDFDAFLTLAP